MAQQDPLNSSDPRSASSQSAVATMTILGSFQKLLRQPSFIIVAGILLITAVSLNAAAEYMQLYFKKMPVELSRDLKTIPAHLGHWVQVSKDEPLEPDLEHVLAATHYLFRDYVDDRIVSAQELDQFKDKTYDQRKELLRAIQMRNPDAVINIGITYYTGMVDTVAHIPDRCYIADGYEPKSYKIAKWTAFNGRPGRAPDGDVHYISFEDQIAARQSAPRNVAYFFQANGQYTSDPIGVRIRLQDLTQRYSYYAKVELMTQMRNANESARVMNDFLTSALPEIEKCLPDWKKVEAQGK